MEAPEKIYADPEVFNISDEFNDLLQTKEEGCIEYIRTDAFIEKACEWLKENFSFDEAGYCKTNIYSVKSMVYNFKNTLGGKL